MRRWAERTVRRWWAGDLGAPGSVATLLAAPLEWAYAWEVARRNRGFDGSGGVRVPGVRVVSMGNLTVGGTGKTPLSAWAAALLRDGGTPVALACSGYGEDEPRLHRRWNPDIPVMTAAVRREAVERAAAAGARAVVLDDGFQHRRLARDLDLVLVSAEDPFPGRLLPRGPFREPTSSLRRAHGVIVTRRTAPADRARSLAETVRREHGHLTTGVVALLPGGWQDLGGRPSTPPVGSTVSVAAVARPEAFAAQVAASTGNDTELISFPDHHDYREDEVRTLQARAGGRTIVVTEKDAVKLERFAAHLGPVRVLVQTLNWEEGEANLRALITSTPPGEA